MGLLDLGSPKIKKVKIEPIKLSKIHVVKGGVSGLTPAQKRKMKEAVGNRCGECGKKFDSEYLQIHHKKSLASHKHPLGLSTLAVGHKKPKVKADRKSNLQVVCIKCHNKTKKKKTKKKNSLGVWRYK